MLKIIHKSAPVKLDPKTARTFQSHLQGRFNSLLAGVRLEYARRLGLEDDNLTPDPVDEDGKIRLGEIFLTEPGTVCFVRYDGDSDALEASAISNSAESNLSNFFDEVSSCLAESGARPGDWTDARSEAAIPEDAEPASTEVSEKELEAARELMKPESRKLLEQLASQESILVREIDSSGVKELFSSLQHFEDLELIRKDYAVIDQKTGQQILRVPSRASLEEASQKFFIGGTAISNDNVDEVISCTPFCRHLLSEDQWLLLLLLGTLKELNLGPDSVYVCRSESAPSRVYLETSRQRFLIVLSNRRLALDDAYLVGAQVAAYDLKDIIVVSTDKTSTLMRHHLMQNNESANFAFVDALSDLETQMRSILLERQRQYLKEILDPLAELTPVKVQDLIVKKMVPGGSEPEAVSEAEPEEEVLPVQDPISEEAEEPNAALRMADSFESSVPGELPAFEGEIEEPEAAAEPEESPEEDTEMAGDDPFPDAEVAVPDVPGITEPPQTEEENDDSSDESESDDSEPSSEYSAEESLPDFQGDLPEAEEMLPDLPLATESVEI